MLTGIRYFFAGVGLLNKPGIRRFVIIPLLLNVVIFSSVFWLGIQWFDRIISTWLPTWLAWAEFILWPLFALAYFLLVFYLFALLANVIAAPFNDLLAEKVEHYLRGSEPSNPTSNVEFMVGISRSVSNELSKLAYFLLRSLPLLLLFLIPGLNLIAPFVWFFFSAWMLALEYLDYPFSNHDSEFKQTRKTIRTKRNRCLGFGGVITAFNMVPILNFIVMPSAVAGATVFYVKEFQAIEMEKSQIDISSTTD